jgi:NAD-dependent dihydropyrimidine dehydrogenase PreA subunit
MPLTIDYKKCIGCKKCYTICPMDIFSWGETEMPVIAYEYECAHCGICWIECPKRAIDLTLPVANW